MKIMLRILSSPDPTSKQAHVNLGHFEAEMMQRSTNVNHSARNKVENKTKKKDNKLKYERLCRGETRKVGINDSLVILLLNPTKLSHVTLDSHCYRGAWCTVLL